VAECSARFERMLGGERDDRDEREEARQHWHAYRRARPRLAGELLAALRASAAPARAALRDPRAAFRARDGERVLPESWQQRIKARIGMGAAATFRRRRPRRSYPVLPLQPSEIDFYLRAPASVSTAPSACSATGPLSTSTPAWP
jgi:hypothetical protein